MEFALKQGRVLVLDAAEAKERWESASFWNEMEYMLQSNRMHFSKAVVLADAVVGEIMWHPEEAYDGRAVSIIYYLDRSELVLIGQKTRHDHWEKQLRSLISDEDDLSPVRFFIRLLDELLKDDIKHLQRIEAGCFQMEEEIQSGEKTDPTGLMAKYRKILLNKSFQYQQMMDMSDTLVENVNDFFDEKEVICFQTYGQKVERLYNRSKMLREYMLQIRELQQQRLDEEQNRIMRILTIVTAIFSPLTLVAGWYGMNFVGMPELKSPYGYPVVAIVCGIIILLEFIYFKHKKML